MSEKEPLLTPSTIRLPKSTREGQKLSVFAGHWSGYEVDPVIKTDLTVV
jgi:hypothetical protein